MNPSITSSEILKKEAPPNFTINKPVNQTLQKNLLLCGILSSLLYTAMNIFVPMYYSGYNSVAQTVSELSAIDAPTRPIWVLLAAVYTLLVTAFGWGVWMSAGRSKPVRIAGALIFTMGFIGLFWPFFPMHTRGVETTLSDTMHIVFSLATVFLMLLSIGFGAAGFGKRFRLYSIATIMIFVVFGTLSGIDSPRIAENLPTPWLGIWERINIGAFLLWAVVLAIMILRRIRSRDKTSATKNNILRNLEK
jgi:MFS family permease